MRVKRYLLTMATLLMINTGCSAVEITKSQLHEETAVPASSGADNRETEQIGTAQTELNQTESERYEILGDSINDCEVNLAPEVKDFLAYKEDGILDFDPSGTTYGFVEDYWEGCSVWCAITYYEATATASSTLAPNGTLSYSADNLLSHDVGNAWVEGVPGNGIGETVEIRRRFEGGTNEGFEKVFFPAICIVNGYAKDESTFINNGRVKTLKMSVNGEYVCDLNLIDTAKPQYISLRGLNLFTSFSEDCVFSFEIADVYPGEAYEDTAITGIEIQIDTVNH